MLKNLIKIESQGFKIENKFFKLFQYDFIVIFSIKKSSYCELISVNANTQGRSVARCFDFVT